jgi:hypothetical protein
MGPDTNAQTPSKTYSWGEDNLEIGQDSSSPDVHGSFHYIWDKALQHTSAMRGALQSVHDATPNEVPPGRTEPRRHQAIG